MQPHSPVLNTQPLTPVEGASDANVSGVSWAAIFAGATAAAALSLILAMLGLGLGLSAISPWANRGVSSTTIAISAIVWLALTQIIASGVGGYLAGRLRVKWAAIHNDEVYFRDTAHGMLAWAVATLAGAALLGTILSGILSGGVQLGSALASGAAHAAASTASAGAQNSDTNGKISYFVDSLFRSDQPISGTDYASHVEAARIFANDLKAGALPPEDRTYLAKIVAKRTGLTQADAEKRVSDIYARTNAALKEAEATARDAADKARKAAAATELWMFIALLCGAFVASLAATYGGKQRDSVYR